MFNIKFNYIRKKISLFLIFNIIFTQFLFAKNKTYTVTSYEEHSNGKTATVNIKINYNDHAPGDIITVVNDNFFTSYQYLGVDPKGVNDQGYDIDTLDLLDNGGKHLLRSIRFGELDDSSQAPNSEFIGFGNDDLKALQESRSYGFTNNSDSEVSSENSSAGTGSNKVSNGSSDSFNLSQKAQGALSSSIYTSAVNRTASMLYNKLVNDEAAQESVNKLIAAQNSFIESSIESEKNIKDAVQKLQLSTQQTLKLTEIISKKINPFDYSRISNDYEFQTKEQSFVNELQNLRSTLKATITQTPEKDLLRNIGVTLVSLADESYAANDKTEGRVLAEYAYEISDVIVGLDPITGVSRDLYEAFVGKNLITGKRLSSFERSFAVFGSITFGFGSKLGKGLKLFKKIGDKYGFSHLNKSLEHLPELITKYKTNATYRINRLWNTELKFLRENNLLYQISNKRDDFVQNLSNIKKWMLSPKKAKIKDLNENWLDSIDIDIKSGNIGSKKIDNGLSTISPESHKVFEQDFVLGEAGESARFVNLKPEPLNKDMIDWGLTKKHLDKHFFTKTNGEGMLQKFSLVNIDPGGTGDKWVSHLSELFSAPVTDTLPGKSGIVNIYKMFPRADGKGSFRMGIRLSPVTDGSFDLVTVLTKQENDYFQKFPRLKGLPLGKGVN